MLEFFKRFKRIDSSLDNQYNQVSHDALEDQRQEDILKVEQWLKQHDLYGAFFSKNWLSLKKYIRLEDYHKDVFFVKHDELTRKVFLLVSGTVNAYVISPDVAHPIVVYTYSLNSLMSELGALFGSPWHFGLLATSNCSIISIDLDYLEDEEAIEMDSQLYREFIELLYNETGKVCTEIFNYMLANKIDLNDLLGKHNFFADIKKLNTNNLHKLVTSMEYVFLPSNTMILDQNNRKDVYIIESGVIEQVKSYDEADSSLAYIENNNLQSVDFIYKNSQIDTTTSETIVSGHKQESKTKKYNYNNTDQHYDFNRRLITKDSSQDKKIIIKEDIYRYGTVGEENLSKFNNIEILATTKTPCCLLSIDIEKIIAKDSFIAQIFGFFNNKVNNLENKIINKHHHVTAKDKYKAKFVSFSFLVLVVMAIMNLIAEASNFFNLPAVFQLDSILLYRAFLITIAYIAVAYLINIYELRPKDFGFIEHHFAHSVFEALFLSIVFITVVITIKDYFSIHLIQSDLNYYNNLNPWNFGLFLLVYNIYLLFYEFCVRGVLQNILSRTLDVNNNMQFWGSILAASIIGTQFHSSLFQEFSLIFLIINICAGIIYARTRNLFASYVLHAIVSSYILFIGSYY